MKVSRKSSSTDLEAVVLGVLWRRKGATAYAVRCELAASPLARFSASAGAVYPLVRRLARLGQISSRKLRQGQRAAQLWRLTPQGLAQLRAWLRVPESSKEVLTWDPLRTRQICLGALSMAERKRWVRAAERALETELAQAKSMLAQDTSDPWLQLAHRNAWLQTQSRLQWLSEVRAFLRCT